MSVETVEPGDILDVLGEWRADEEVPDGWFRVTRLAAKMRIAPQRIRNQLAAKHDRGEIVLECKRFPVLCFDGSRRSVAHYRIGKP